MDSIFQPLFDFLGRHSPTLDEIRAAIREGLSILPHAPLLAIVQPRKVLEHAVRRAGEVLTGEPSGKDPIENVIGRLLKKGHLTTRLEAYATQIRLLGNVGAHSLSGQITPADVRQSYLNLLPVLEWYVGVVGGGPVATGSHLTGFSSQHIPVFRPEHVAIIPKGLRAFDAGDAEFFLELLPGVRDRRGVPDSIRFWMQRILTPEHSSFTVGLLCGPSGSGKSSLVKAGLLPQLPDRVLKLVIDATGDTTEAQLVKGLRDLCPSLPPGLSLADTMLALRRGTGLAAGQKVLVVLDQFEQWLHARRGQTDGDLARALRQCDGEHVQCLLMVRDDFFLPTKRFMADLGVHLDENRNLALVDLFPADHARYVLVAFGRAYRKLGPTLSRDEDTFLDHAIRDLSQDARVVCVRLVLFAEMVKNRPWTTATLDAIGGIEYVGAAFLEETFGKGAGARNREHHRHQVKLKSKRDTSLSNSTVPGLARLFRRHVFATTFRKSSRTRSSSFCWSNAMTNRVTKARIASHTLPQLRLGSPHEQDTTNQCCTTAASNLAHTRTICRTSVEPCNTATRSCDFQRLNSNSICQRARYRTTASRAASNSTGTLVTRIVQSHHAMRATLGSQPRLLRVSLRSFCRRRLACSSGKRHAINRHGNCRSLPNRIN